MNPNYGNKAIFPLETLGRVAAGNAGFDPLTSLTILLPFKLLALQYIPLTIFYLQLVWIPLI